MVRAAVVILNWNGHQHLEKFLPSVVRHTPQWADIFVADNGSTDSSVEFVTSHYPTIKIIRLDKNYGFAEGYNRALQKVNSEYFVLLNSDVEVTEGWLEPLVATLSDHPKLGAIAPKILSCKVRVRRCIGWIYRRFGLSILSWQNTINGRVRPGTIQR